AGLAVLAGDRLDLLAVGLADDESQLALRLGVAEGGDGDLEPHRLTGGDHVGDLDLRVGRLRTDVRVVRLRGASGARGADQAGGQEAGGGGTSDELLHVYVSPM